MWKALRERFARTALTLSELPEDLRVGLRFWRQSGLASSLTIPGAKELARSLMTGTQNPAQVYRIHAANAPRKSAVVWRDEVTTFAALDQRIDRIASGLDRRGIGRRSAVVVMMRNRQEMIEVGAAISRAGGAAVNVSWRSTPSELAYLATHSGARAIFLESDFLPSLEHVQADVPRALLAHVFAVPSSSAAIRSKLTVTPLAELLGQPAQPLEERSADDDDAAIVVYTSGTTGRPKGAVRKFPRNTAQAALRFINETPLRVDDVHLAACPMYHSTAFAFVTLGHLLGQTVVVMDDFKPEAFLELVERHRVTTTALVPTMIHRIVELPAAVRRRYDTRSLRIVFSGGSALPPGLGTAFMDLFGDTLYNFYGSTETGLVTLARPADLRAAPGTIGRAVPGNDIRLLDDERRDVVPGEVGEVFVKNRLSVVGYHADVEATRASTVDGYFSVGDLARCDGRGLYFLEGRKRDMIISGGVNVYPAEVEGRLEEHPEILEAAVIGVADSEWGERVRAFVVRRAGSALDEGAVRAFAREKLSGPKIPREVVFVDSLPRNPTGKVLKRELREHRI